MKNNMKLVVKYSFLFLTLLPPLGYTVEVSVPGNEESINNYTPPKTYTYNFNELNNVQTDVATLTTKLMGDKIDPATGTISWTQTDVSLPGNFDLPVTLERELSDTSNWTGASREFGNWSLSVPHVRSSYVADNNGVFEDVTISGGIFPAWANNLACSSGLNANPDLRKTIKGSLYTLNKEDYWQGDTISIPNVGSEKIQADGTTKKTTSNWKINCVNIKSQHNEELVDAFEVTLPNGVKYLFSELKVVYSHKDVFLTTPNNPCLDACSYSAPVGESIPDEKLRLKQINVFMQVTKVTDRFGNWVKYEYNNDSSLIKIHSSDNRNINIDYDGNTGLIKQVEVNDRKWAYAYQKSPYDDELLLLKDVLLPDNRKWKFDYPLNDNRRPFWSRYYIGRTSQLDPISPTICSAAIRGDFINITHPSGAVGKFALKERCIGQAAVPKLEEFNRFGQGGPSQSYALQVVSSQYAVDSKSIDLGDRVYQWDYNYSDMPGYFYGDTVPSNAGFIIDGMPSTVDLGFITNSEPLADISATLVSHPDGNHHLTVSDRKYGYQNGKQKYYATYNSTFELMSYVAFKYDESEQDYGQTKQWAVGIEEYMPNGVPLEFEGQTLFDAAISSSKHIRLIDKQVVLTDGGVKTIYSEAHSDFNKYEQAQTITQQGPVYKRVTSLTFVHDENSWILNQPSTVDVNVNNTGKVRLSEKTYYDKTDSRDAYKFNLKEEKYFGVTRKSYPSYITDVGAIGQIKDVDLQVDENIKRRITFTDYKRGQAEVVTVPARYSDSFMKMRKTIDDNGWVTSTTDFNGITTKYGYDLSGMVTTIDYPNDINFNRNWEDILYDYNYPISGGLIRTENRCILNTDMSACASTPSLSVTQTYDSFLRLESVAETANDAITTYQNFSYDSNNQKTFESFKSESFNEIKGKIFSYDSLKRLKRVSTTNMGNVEYIYKPNNTIEYTDAEDNVTTTTYLAYGSPSYEQATKIESPENVTTDIDIDLFGNITSITQSSFYAGEEISQTELRAYDEHYNLCKVSRSDVGTNVYTYNLLGEMQWQAQGVTEGAVTNCTSNATINSHEDSAKKVSFTYDNLGDQHSIIYGDGSPTRTFALDNNGNIKKITGNGFTQSYNYNSLNLLEDETLTIDGRVGSLTLDYGYDTLGNLSSLKYPDGSAPVEFAPNGFGQATQAIRTASDDIFVKGANNKATYHPNGMVGSFTYGNGIVHKTTLNDRQIPNQLTDKLGSSDIMNLSYTYDNNTNITSLTNTLDEGIYSLSNLTYDGLDRLISTTGGLGIGSSSINYDGLGNIRSYSNDSLFNLSDLTYNYKANFQLDYVNTTGTNTKVRDFSANNSYDAKGNVLKNGSREFKYNLDNQMVESGTNSYVYDGYNRRIKTQDSKGTSYSFYSQAGKLLYRETPKGGINYIFLGDKLIAKEGTGVVTPEESSNMNYKPFGESIEEPKDDVGYTGHKFDTDLGLSYMQARYYDPVIGRFYSNDPVGYTAKNPVMSFNRYMYVNNNPYKYTDPNGELLFQAVGFAIGAVSSYRAAKRAGLSGKSLAAATLIGGGVGALTGGFGGTVVSTGIKAAVSKALGASTTQVVKTVVGNTASGAIAGATGETVGSIANDKLPTKAGLIDSASKGAFSGSIGGGVATFAGPVAGAVAAFGVDSIGKASASESTAKPIEITLKCGSECEK